MKLYKPFYSKIIILRSFLIKCCFKLENNHLDLIYLLNYRIIGGCQKQKVIVQSFTSLHYSSSPHLINVILKFSVFGTFILLLAAKRFSYSWSSSILPRVLITSGSTLSSPLPFLGISLAPEFSLSLWEQWCLLQRQCVDILFF